MLRVPAPCGLNERNGSTAFGCRASALKHKVKVMLVAVEISPANLIAFPRRSGVFLVEVKAVLCGKVAQYRLDGYFENSPIVCPNL